MVDGRDIISGICGAIVAFVLFFLAICIGAVINQQGIREQVTDWFGVQTTAEQLPSDDTGTETPSDDASADDSTTEEPSTNPSGGSSGGSAGVLY